MHNKHYNQQSAIGVVHGMYFAKRSHHENSKMAPAYELIII